ncbi:MAG: transposase family protein [Methylococcaceae bacterium]|nr:transposase family protein [Methylococcaceae bacterium]
MKLTVRTIKSLFLMTIEAGYDGIKGVYLINAVDEVTQFQAVFAVERISEAYLLPVLAAMMDAFPFVIRGFHSDNGSEYINHKVANLLEKLRIEQTKSRSRQTNDNALAESKNASTVRKYLGYSHIPQHLANQLNTFTAEVLSPYLNYHRLCHFPTEYQDKKGKIRKRYLYQDMMTPYEQFRSLPAAESYLKLGTTLEKLDALAAKCSDNEAAQHLTEERAKLFQLSGYPFN